jgi:hypothetical protein
MGPGDPVRPGLLELDPLLDAPNLSNKISNKRVLIAIASGPCAFFWTLGFSVE